MAKTAEASVTVVEVARDTEGRYATVRLVARTIDDEGNRLNEDWSYADPHLGMSMTVRGSVADEIEEGQHYTLSLTLEA